MAKAVKQTDSGVSKLQDALDKLNKAYGTGTVLSLDSKTDGHYDVISTGSIGFDWTTLGTGGFVKGTSAVQKDGEFYYINKIGIKVAPPKDEE